MVFYFPEAGGNFVFLGKNLVLNYCDVVQTSSVESFTSKLLWPLMGKENVPKTPNPRATHEQWEFIVASTL